MKTNRPAGRPTKAAPSQTYPRWPVVLLAGSAFVAIWGGWVELGRMSGFGPVNLLPGIADLYVDLAITLPLGMEVYAAYAMGAWLTRKPITSAARTFAKWSALVSLTVGGAGQVAYHLLAEANIDHAPWQVVVIVACVPVAVLGMASLLAHHLHDPSDRPAAPEAGHAEAPEAGHAEAPDATATDDVPAIIAPLPAITTAPVAATAAADQTTASAGRRRGPVTSAERARIFELASAGMSERAIHREVRRSRDTVARILDEPQPTTPADRPIDRPQAEGGMRPATA